MTGPRATRGPASLHPGDSAERRVRKRLFAWQPDAHARLRLALEGRYSLDEAHPVVGVLEAPSVVAVGKLKIHAGDERGAAEKAEIAEIMPRASAPSVQSHASWYLALHAMSQGKADEAHDWLCARL